MTRPWLVMLNSTRTALSPTLFNVIISTEIMLSTVGCLIIPIVAEAIYNAGVIHRNFRIQVRLMVATFIMANAARSVLIYYQLFDVPLEDDDIVLILANITRDSMFGYLFGMITSFAAERSFATFYWEWYERQTPDTMLVIFAIEATNLFLAATNSTCWLFGYWNFTINVLLLMITVISGFILFMSIYQYNRHLLRRMSMHRSGYSVAKTFQIRENCKIMKCLMNLGLPAGSLTSVGFSLFCYYEWAPVEWELSRYISIALFDLFVATFIIFYMVLALNMDSEFKRQFNMLPLICRLRKALRIKPPTYAKSVLKSAHDVQPGVSDTTHSYFNQLDASWMR